MGLELLRKPVCCTLAIFVCLDFGLGVDDRLMFGVE